MMISLSPELSALLERYVAAVETKLQQDAAMDVAVAEHREKERSDRNAMIENIVDQMKTVMSSGLSSMFGGGGSDDVDGERADDAESVLAAYGIDVPGEFLAALSDVSHPAHARAVELIASTQGALDTFRTVLADEDGFEEA
jgi:hypothetical protein